MRTSLFVLATFATSAVAQSDERVGSYSPAPLTDDKKKLLHDTLVSNNYENSVGSTRVCYTDIISLETQIVAGTNNKFHISGCSVNSMSEGECSQQTLTSCTVMEYDVIIFEPLFTGKPQVSNIQQHPSEQHPSEPVHPYQQTPLTHENKELLKDTLAGNNYANSVGTTRVCYKEIESLFTQDVDGGSNLKYTISGCSVPKSDGRCSEETRQSCTLAEFDVIIYQQTGDTSAQVTDIEEHKKVPQGDYQPTPLTHDAKELLKHGLESNNYTSSVGKTRVCYKDIISLETQTVDGTNFKFTISGCSVTVPEGKCSKRTLASCTLTQYDVTIYQPPNTKAVQVTNIQPTPRFQPSTLTDDKVQLLKTALTGNNYASSVGDMRVCYKNVTSLEEEKNDGTYYLFTLFGCQVPVCDEGACSDQTLTSCQVKEYTVTIYDSTDSSATQSGTLQVTSIIEVVEFHPDNSQQNYALPDPAVSLTNNAN
ncbi:hypothetical protein PsorP6_001710 [Peronosclerospora sorghi]|uniref:Uncharacterized protein n=1 Tax=Peronosclerospora sorghi TaxID=230839 RepID=A0ACC0WPU6_9STRA|nr:hypothetical protein PsorP6_001710 [Peronosclerospora sorghi]